MHLFRFLFNSYINSETWTNDEKKRNIEEKNEIKKRSIFSWTLEAKNRNTFVFAFFLHWLWNVCVCTCNLNILLLGIGNFRSIKLLFLHSPLTKLHHTPPPVCSIHMHTTMCTSTRTLTDCKWVTYVSIWLNPGQKLMNHSNVVGVIGFFAHPCNIRWSQKRTRSRKKVWMNEEQHKIRSTH